MTYVLRQPERASTLWRCVFAPFRGQGHVFWVGAQKKCAGPNLSENGLGFPDRVRLYHNPQFILTLEQNEHFAFTFIAFFTFVFHHPYVLLFSHSHLYRTIKTLSYVHLPAPAPSFCNSGMKITFNSVLSPF
jgi:hypothetical protein